MRRGRETRDVCAQRKHALWGHGKMTAICKPRREASGETALLAPSSWTSILQNHKKINCCSNHTVCGILF